MFPVMQNELYVFEGDKVLDSDSMGVALDKWLLRGCRESACRCEQYLWHESGFLLPARINCSSGFNYLTASVERGSEPTKLGYDPEWTHAPSSNGSNRHSVFFWNLNTEESTLDSSDLSLYFKKCF